MAQGIYDNINPATRKSVKVYSYGLQVFLNPFFIVLFTVTLGLLLGTLKATLITMVSFILLRFVSGGYHLKSDACVMVSTIVMVSLPLIRLEQYQMYISIVTLITVSLLAPINIQAQVKWPEKHNFTLKIASILLVLTNMLFINSYIIALSFMAQALSLIIEFMRRRIYDD